jgi:hypothetical protein
MRGTFHRSAAYPQAAIFRSRTGIAFAAGTLLRFA